MPRPRTYRTLALLTLIALSVRVRVPAANDPSNAAPVEAARLGACSGLPPADEFVRANRHLEQLYGTDPRRFQQVLTDFVTRYNNLGVSSIDFSNGTKKVFRSSILSRNPACLEQLVKTQGVRSIVNLYAGDLIDEQPLAAAEEAAFGRFGGQSYIHVLGLSDHPIPGQTVEQIHARLAAVIGLIRAAPGNVLVHCVGGIHRTGEVYGLLQKCINHLPLEAVIGDYIRHAGGTARNNPEYRTVNVAIIRSFDCRQLVP